MFHLSDVSAHHMLLVLIFLFLSTLCLWIMTLPVFSPVAAALTGSISKLTQKMFTRLSFKYEI